MPPKQPSRRLLPRHIALLAIGATALGHYVILALLGDPLNFGTLLSLAVAIVGLGVPLLRFVGRPLPSLGPRPRRVLQVSGGVAIAWYLAMLSWMIVEARSDERESVDVVLVLGAGLKDGRPTPALKRRVARAAHYLEAHPNVPAIACGGIGTGQPISEAEVIGEELVRRGIAPARLRFEKRSTSTVENLRFARPLMDDLVPKERPRILIITSNFHLARAKMLARRQGFEAFGVPASTPWYILPNTTARESVAIVKSILLDR